MTHQDRPPDEDPKEQLSDDVQWIQVATAPDQLTAEMWQQLMWQDGIPAILDPRDTISFMGITSTPVRLEVPVELVAKARDVLAGVEGAADWIDTDGTGESESAGED